MNTALQESAAQHIEKMEELVKERRVESNIASAIESLSLCLPVLTTYAKLQKQMKEKRFVIILLISSLFSELCFNFY